MIKDIFFFLFSSVFIDRKLSWGLLSFDELIKLKLYTINDIFVVNSITLNLDFSDTAKCFYDEEYI